jgi:hypothetical protein
LNLSNDDCISFERLAHGENASNAADRWAVDGVATLLLPATTPLAQQRCQGKVMKKKKNDEEKKKKKKKNDEDGEGLS